MSRVLGRPLQVVVVVATVAATLFGLSDAASASTGNQVPVSTVYSYGCTYELLATWDGHGTDYAAARIAAGDDTTITCMGALERSSDGGNSWSQVSGWHWEAANQSVTTYNYLDTAGYLARVHYQVWRQPDLYNDFVVADGYTGTW